MKNLIKLSLTLCVTTLLISSCKKQEVRDVTIKYEVTLSNPNRDATVYFNNETGGEDVVQLASSSFSKSYEVKSNKAKSEFKIRAYCYSLQAQNGSYEPQTITLKITEDDKVIQEKTVSGTATIYSSNNTITASLPSATKYK